MPRRAQVDSTDGRVRPYESAADGEAAKQEQAERDHARGVSEARRSAGRMQPGARP